MHPVKGSSALKRVAFLLGLVGLSIVSRARTRTANVAIGTGKTGAPISKYFYSHFPEHGGNIVNEGVWAEILKDRGFYYPVTSKPSEQPATSARGRHGQPRYWMPIGGDDVVRMYRDHFGVIPVGVSGDSPQPKPSIPAGGVLPAVNPASDTYPLDLSAALSEDRKTLTFAVLNPSDAKQSMKLAINGTKFASHGKLWQFAPAKLDAVVAVGETPEVAVEEHSLGAAPDTIGVPPFSVRIDSFSVQQPGV